MAHSEKLEDLLEGKPVVIIEDGELAWSKLNNSNMTEFEFFMELRLRGVEQLGQVRLAILETNGQISVYFFEDDKVKPGLLILPSDCTQRYKVVPESADYACIRCSEIIHMKAGEKQLCPRCANPEWTKASRGKTGDLTVKNIGFLLIIREILLCDASHICALNGFTHCDVCH
ncbi:membrane protein YcaP [Escherichia coli]|uniref:Membrane protein YcaP n=1 Tax=Escherichia coli TaxID=562 RepID=A0A2X1IXF9_ECOLX|nr:membrane protein YcaP [Escherichia coli]